MGSKIRRFVRDINGVTALEYGMLTALIALAVAFVLLGDKGEDKPGLAGDFGASFESITGELNTADDDDGSRLDDEGDSGLLSR